MNRIKMLTGLVLFVSIIGIYSCENNAVTPVNLPIDCDTTDLTYTNSMQFIIDLNCGTLNTGCHSSGSNRDLSTYAALQRDIAGGQKSRFWQEIFVEKKMPLYPELSLDVCTTNKFKVWLLNGAPQ